jgi:hypothetical protein
MASITGKPNIFFITSPRSPYKMKEEIKILVDNFSHQCWTSNSRLQENFYRKLAEQSFFIGSLDGDLAFKGRDRITRGPKALGLVDLEPEIMITEAGNNYLYGTFPNEAFTRQLLKFQFPSPYHIDDSGCFHVKPYLELFRLIYELNGLSKYEIAAFVMQLNHINKYKIVKEKIIEFRKGVELLDKSKTNYKRYFDEIFTKEIIETYKDQLSTGETNTRESEDGSRRKFIETKKSNHLDYADAAFRYLRETKLFSLKSYKSTKIYIDEKKTDEVKFLLDSISRDPVYIEDENEYKKYLFSGNMPLLFTDNKEQLIAQLTSDFPQLKKADLEKIESSDLKGIKYKKSEERLSGIIQEQQRILHTYENYSDIVEVFDSIESKTIFDPSLFLEWNTWRAFVMLDDGKVIGNFKLDDSGLPLSTAPGNQSDILCEYEKFDLTVEVTLSTGVTQYNMEGEPVARHLGNMQKASSKDCFSIFITPSLNAAALSHFYVLHRTPTHYYGGTARIIPIQLSEFRRMVELAKKGKNKPNSKNIETLVRSASDLALSSKDENEWYSGIQELIETWV